MTKKWVRERIRWRKIDGAVVILDLLAGEYFVLDPVATAAWEDLSAGTDWRHTIARLTVEYAIPEERIAADLSAFLVRLEAQGFVTDAAPSGVGAQEAGRHVEQKPFLILRAWRELFRASRLLARRGFAPTYAAYSAIPAPASPKDLPVRLSKALAAFARAENFFHMRRAPEDCLPRSLALFRFLRNAGIPAEHCIGVRRFPFGAHSWVEHAGRVVHDHPAQPRIYTEIARVPAWQSGIAG